MEKLYGYREKDIIGLAEFIKTGRKRSLTETFATYAESSGKARGTVRNLYYALAKTAAHDEQFRKKYFDGIDISVNKIVTFGEDEEYELVKKIISATRGGRSVRSVIYELAAGDGKVALRLQNKYRGILKNKPSLVDRVRKEIGIPCEEKEDVRDYFSELQFRRVKTEINGLVRKIAQKERQEAQALKNKVFMLEAENARLKELLSGAVSESEAPHFIIKGGGNVIN